MTSEAPADRLSAGKLFISWVIRIAAVSGIGFLNYYTGIVDDGRTSQWGSVLILLSMTYLASSAVTDIFGAVNHVKFHSSWVIIHFLALVAFTFVGTILAFALMYRIYGLRDTSNQMIVHDPEISVYFSVMTLTTVGYGDFVPANYMSRTFAAIQAVSGFFLLAGVIGFSQLVHSSAKKI